MKIVCQRERLLSALQVVSATVGPTTTRPVLQDVKMEAGEDSLSLVTTDLEVGVRYRIADVEVERPGEALVPARRLTEIVRVVTDEALELDWNDNTLILRGNRRRFRVLGEDPAEFPGIPEVEETGAGKLPAETLTEMLRSTAFAAAAQSTRYTLNGVFWEVEGRNFHMTATDGHRLAHIERTFSEPVSTPTSGIVPTKAVQIMERSLRDDEEIIIRLGDNDLLVRGERVTIYTRLLEGNFPRYREVIPTTSTLHLELPVAELAQCVREAAVLTSEESRAVRFRFETDRLILTSATPGAGDAEIEMSIDYSGDPFVIGFNPKFIADALSPVEDETVHLEMRSPEDPGLIRDGKGYLCVIMPLNVAEDADVEGSSRE